MGARYICIFSGQLCCSSDKLCPGFAQEQEDLILPFSFYASLEDTNLESWIQGELAFGGDN